jgi:hypothetical protein
MICCELGRWWEETFDQSALSGAAVANSEQDARVWRAEAPIVDSCWLDSSDGCN